MLHARFELTRRRGERLRALARSAPGPSFSNVPARYCRRIDRTRCPAPDAPRRARGCSLDDRQSIMCPRSARAARARPGAIRRDARPVPQPPPRQIEQRERIEDPVRLKTRRPAARSSSSARSQPIQHGSPAKSSSCQRPIRAASHRHRQPGARRCSQGSGAWF